MKKTLLLILFFVVLAPQSADTKPLITILRGQDFPPYHFSGPSGIEAGFIVEIIQAVAKDLDVEVRFEQYPWSRCLRMVKLGKADAMMNLFKTRERAEFMYFSNNILAYETNQFFKRKNSSFEYSGDPSTLSGFKIGAIRNYNYGAEFIDRARLENLFRLETERDLIKSLVNKRCEAIIGNTIVINMLVKKMGFEIRVEPVFPIVSKAPLYIGFSKARGHGKLSDDFSRALYRLKTSDTYGSILKRYNR